LNDEGPTTLCFITELRRASCLFFCKLALPKLNHNWAEGGDDEGGIARIVSKNSVFGKACPANDKGQEGRQSTI